MKLTKLIATGFGTGYLPIGPGSWGTFPGMILCVAMQSLPPSVYLIVVVILAWIGVYFAGEGERMIGKKDPGAVVIDEIVAFPLTMFLIPLSAGTLILGFFLNRLMDTVKLWPCDDLQKLPRGWGIMLDDMVAAIYSCLLMHLSLHFWPWIAGFHPLGNL